MGGGVHDDERILSTASIVDSSQRSSNSSPESSMSCSPSYGHPISVLLVMVVVVAVSAGNGASTSP